MTGRNLKNNYLLTATSKFFLLWLTLLLFMTAARIVFILISPSFIKDSGSLFFGALAHGLPTDLTASAYLMVVPGIYNIVRIWYARPWLDKALKCYFWIIATGLSVIYVLDAVLFQFWQFRLDTTPFYYFFTSPAASLASMNVWIEVLLVVLIVVLAYGLNRLLNKAWETIGEPECQKRILSASCLTLCVLLLFIPIRGGFTEATMTPGRGFFCNNIFFNQATVNPMFSLLYSIAHHFSPEEEFRFFDKDTDAEKELRNFESKQIDKTENYTVELSSERPDVYLIILESFSARIMPSLGGAPIARGLDSLATRESILFTRFYAESFRTDRALPAILSGYPAQPTTSAMRYTSKLGNFPSLISLLKENGWETAYYYGGDADFTNMGAYLFAQGIEKLVSEKDFPKKERIAKWGVPDHLVFKKVLEDIKPDAKQTFTIVQTSSSHHPFDIGFDIYDNPALNSFAYADDRLVKFIEGLKKQGQWENSLVIIVADHWACWPDNLHDATDRHHIPLVMTGGAVLNTPALIPVVASQADLAPTLAKLLNLDPSRFVFGHDMLDNNMPHYARVSDREGYGLINSLNEITFISDDTDKVLQGRDSTASRAFIQLLYSDFTGR